MDLYYTDIMKKFGRFLHLKKILVILIVVQKQFLFTVGRLVI